MDFSKSIGRDTDIKLYKPIDKVKEFEGILKAFDNDTLTFLIDGNERVFNKSEVASVKLHVEF